MEHDFKFRFIFYEQSSDAFLSTYINLTFIKVFLDSQSL